MELSVLNSIKRDLSNGIPLAVLILKYGDAVRGLVGIKDFPAVKSLVNELESQAFKSALAQAGTEHGRDYLLLLSRSNLSRGLPRFLKDLIASVYNKVDEPGLGSDPSLLTDNALEILLAKAGYRIESKATSSPSQDLLIKGQDQTEDGVIGGAVRIRGGGVSPAADPNSFINGGPIIFETWSSDSNQWEECMRCDSGVVQFGGGPTTFVTGQGRLMAFVGLGGSDAFLRHPHQQVILTNSVTNNLVLTSSSIYAQSSSPRTITGMVPVGLPDDPEGLEIRIVNGGPGPLTLSHQNASSSPDNRFVHYSNTDVTLQVHQGAILTYRSNSVNRWIIHT